MPWCLNSWCPTLYHCSGEGKAEYTYELLAATFGVLNNDKIKDLCLQRGKYNLDKSGAQIFVLNASEAQLQQPTSTKYAGDMCNVLGGDHPPISCWPPSHSSGSTTESVPQTPQSLQTSTPSKEDSELGNDTLVASEADLDSAHRTKQKKRKSASLMSNK